MNVNLAISFPMAHKKRQSFVINLPIVHIDPNSRLQPHQPIAIPKVIRVLAIAIYLVSVVVESKQIHEYTTTLNVDNLCWSLFWLHFTLHSIASAHNSLLGHAVKRALETMKSSLEPFCLIAFIAQSTTFVIWNFVIYLSLFGSLQLLFRYHILNSPNEMLFPFFFCRFAR